jgi:hypothetical protein
MANSARLIACEIADLTREVQLRGKGIVGDDGLAGTARLPEAFQERLLEANHKWALFHELEAI